MQHSFFSERRLLGFKEGQPERSATPQSSPEQKKLTEADYHNAWNTEVGFTVVPTQQRFDRAVNAVAKFNQTEAEQLKKDFNQKLSDLIWRVAAIHKKPGDAALKNAANDAWLELYKVMYSAEAKMPRMQVFNGTRAGLDALSKTLPRQKPVAAPKENVNAASEQAVVEELKKLIDITRLGEVMESLSRPADAEYMLRGISRLSKGDLAQAKLKLADELDRRFYRDYLEGEMEGGIHEDLQRQINDKARLKDSKLPRGRKISSRGEIIDEYLSQLTGQIGHPATKYYKEVRESLRKA